MDVHVSFLAELDGLFRGEGDAVQTGLYGQALRFLPVAPQGALTPEQNRGPGEKGPGPAKEPTEDGRFRRGASGHGRSAKGPIDSQT